MNKPISVGDLVQVIVWPCCGHGLGDIYRVGEMRRVPGSTIHCNHCNTGFPVTTLAVSDAVHQCGHYIAAPPAWLKRIPPLDELESEKHREDIREPA